MIDLNSICFENEYSGYVRGYYEYDMESFIKDLQEKMKDIKFKTKEEEIKYIRSFAEENHYRYRGEFVIVRDDMNENGCGIEIEKEYYNI